MIPSPVFEFANILTTFQHNSYYLLILIAGLWLIHFVNWLLGYRLNWLGIYPRSWHGFIGIFFSTFLHGNFNHLFFNSIPLFALASFVLLAGWPTFVTVTVIIILLSGFAIWLVGRHGIHIGASGLIMGYWSYLLMNAYAQVTWFAIVLAAVSLYYFGGLLLDILPGDIRTSWEAHLFGFLAGIAAVYLSPALMPIVEARFF